EAMALAESLLAEAEAVGYAPLEIYARVQVGGLAGALGELDRAEAILSEVFVDAGALGLDEVAVDAANRLIFTVGYSAARHREGVVWSRAAEMLVRRLGQADEPRGATVLNSVANIYFALGEYERSQALFEEALAINQRVLGPEHPIVGDNLTNLADVHYARGEYDRAQELYERSLEISAEALGEVHPSRGYAMNNLANVHLAHGELDRASALLERVLTVFAAAYGADHPELANPTNNLANVRRRRGELEAARDGYSRAVALLEAAFGAEHLALATPLDNLGFAHLLLGDAAAAEPLFTRALTIREASLGASRPEVAEALLHRARARIAAAAWTGAAADLERAQAIREAAAEEGRAAGVAEVIALRGEVELGEGREAAGRARLERAIEALGDGGSASSRGAARFALARSLAATDPARARALAQEAAAIYGEALEERRALAEVEAWLKRQG
ncbi:MAG: tetratricopeptide repeat protein, partial [Nannocystaceae bacterium]